MCIFRYVICVGWSMQISLYFFVIFWIVRTNSMSTYIKCYFKCLPSTCRLRTGYWFNVGPPSATVAQHWANTVSHIYLVYSRDYDVWIWPDLLDKLTEVIRLALYTYMMSGVKWYSYNLAPPHTYLLSPKMKRYTADLAIFACLDSREFVIFEIFHVV